MWFAGGRRLLYLSVILLLVLISVLLFWVSPSPNNGAEVAKAKKLSHKEDLVHKYFRGRAFGPSNVNRTEKGFDDTKRRVPSCPDPLHN